MEEGKHKTFLLHHADPDSLFLKMLCPNNQWIDWLYSFLTWTYFF